MRFVASVLAVGAALSAVPAEAARFLISGSGYVPGSIIYDNSTGRSSGSPISVTFSFVTSGEAGSGAVYEFNNTQIFYNERGLAPSGYGQNFSFSAGGTSLLSGGSGFGNVSFLNSPRSPYGGFGGFSGGGEVAYTIRIVDETTPLSSVNLQVAAVPEPASWATMIAGFGLVGAGMRRRRYAAKASTFSM